MPWPPDDPFPLLLVRVPLLLCGLVAIPASRAATTSCPSGAFAVVGTVSYYWSSETRRYDGAVTGCPVDAIPATFDDQAQLAAMASKGNAGAENNCVQFK